MSVVELFRLPADLRAALIWDVPTLRKGDAAAINFLRAFGPPPWNLSEEASGPLQDAALAVIAAGQGLANEAMSTCKPLIATADPALQLLGRILEAWFAEAPGARARALHAAIDLAVHVSEPEDRARVCRKLAIWAFEVGETALALRTAETAIEGAMTDSHLAWTIRGLLWDLGNRSYPQPAIPPSETDPLLTQPWVSDLGYDALATADLERFRDGLAGAWGGGIRMGQTQADVLNAAQRQADWAAAAALRDRLIQLLCVHLLEGAARSEAQTRWAASSWVLAGGDRITAVLNRAERAINAETARELLKAVRLHPVRRERFPEVAASVWRHVDDTEVSRLLDELDPGEPGQVVRPEPRRVWANLFWRDPDLWYEKWHQLDQQHRQGAMTFLLPEALDRLAPAARADLLATIEHVGDPVTYAVIAGALAIAEGADASRWFDIATPEGIVRLLDWRPGSVPADVIGLKIAGAKQSVRAARDEAIRGTFALGGTDARSALGSLVSHVGIGDEEAEQLLVDVAGDPRMAADDQVQALQGLVFIRKAGLLSERARSQLRTHSDPPGRDLWGTIDPSVLQTARLWTFADVLTRDEIHQVIAAVRAKKQETRLIAVAAIGDILAASPGETTAAWALVSALYDPSDDVLVRALETIGRNALDAESDAAAAAVSGVISSYQTGRSRVRSASVWAARALEAAHAEVAELIKHAEQDRSFEVRYAVQLSADAFGPFK